MVEYHATATLPPSLQLGITVTASLCITEVHCRKSTNFSNRSFKVTCYMETLKGRDQSEEIGVDGKITLEWILEK
jgi:hypothetical protein